MTIALGLDNTFNGIIKLEIPFLYASLNISKVGENEIKAIVQNLAMIVKYENKTLKLEGTIMALLFKLVNAVIENQTKGETKKKYDNEINQ